jgi:hypothetical protein
MMGQKAITLIVRFFWNGILRFFSEPGFGAEFAGHYGICCEVRKLTVKIYGIWKIREAMVKQT